jgi:hypothetical protein
VLKHIVLPRKSIEPFKSYRASKLALAPKRCTDPRKGNRSPSRRIAETEVVLPGKEENLAAQGTALASRKTARSESDLPFTIMTPRTNGLASRSFYEIDIILVYLQRTNTNILCTALRQGTLASLSALLHFWGADHGPRQHGTVARHNRSVSTCDLIP